MSNKRLHLKIGGRRTTITLNQTLAGLLRLKLGAELNEWLQEQIDHDPGAFVGGVSQRITTLTALEIAAPALRAAYERDLHSDKREHITQHTKKKKRPARNF